MALKVCGILLLMCVLVYSDEVMVKCKNSFCQVGHFKSIQQNWTKLGLYIVYHKLSVLQENWRLSLYGF